MVELGNLLIFNGSSLVRARVKMRNVSLKLGFSEIMATRLEGILSELWQGCTSSGRSVSLTVFLTQENGKKGLCFETKNVPEAQKFSFAENFFDKVSVTRDGRGSIKIDAYIYFEERGFPVEPEQISEITDYISVPSRQELMDEISRKNEELSVSRQFMESVLENLRAAVYAKDLEGRYTYVNAEWEAATGFKRADAIGKNSPELFSHEIGEQCQINDMNVITNGEIQVSEEKTILTGLNKTYLSTKVPMRKEDRVIGLCSISTDITERIQMEEELIAAKRMAEDAAKGKADFLANMSHEIRTPMNAIMGMAYLLQKTDLAEKQKDYVDKIWKSSQHLLEIINDILDFSKIEAGKIDIEYTCFRLDEVLENLSGLIVEKCASKGLELIFDIDPKVPNSLCGDPLRISQVLINYVNNAIKFTETGEIIVRIKRQAQEGNDIELRFEVQDTGIGLTPEQQHKLFQSFQQADTSTTRKYGGTGLGLAISKELAGLMGGNVGVSSEYQIGSTFWFTARLNLGTEENYLIPECLKGHKVLVVDDNTHAREILRFMLQEACLRVDEASTGHRAIELIERADHEGEPYRLIYMDMQMPGLNGIQTMARVKQLQLSKIPRCIMVTGFGREEVFLEAGKVGIDLVLVKPVNPIVLYEATTRILAGNVACRNPEQKSEADKIRHAGIHSVKGASILLVEDNELNRQVALELLKEGDFSVDVAENGREALNRLSENKYDLILMDMQMPVMDGISATEKIRSRPEYAELPVVAMTANAMAGDREKCWEAGMNDYLTKPIDPKSLFDMLIKWLPQRIVEASKEEELEVNAERVLNCESEKELEGPTQIRIQVAGLDYEDGLSRALGREKSYFNYLRKFMEEGRTLSQELNYSIGKDDHTTAERIAHTLKGIAGTVGAFEIQAASGSLEADLKLKERRESFADRAAEITLLLQKMAAELDAALPEEEKAVIPEGPAVLGAELLAELESLRPSIVTGKPKNCAEAVEQIRKLRWPSLVEAEMIQMNQLIASYKYKEALNILDQISNKLKGGW